LILVSFGDRPDAWVKSSMAPLPVHPPPATASVVVKWNTAGETLPLAVQYGTLTAIDGRRVCVRLRDGTMRSFTASGNDVGTLRSLLGKTIAFRVR
jgi:hypothetical protein